MKFDLLKQLNERFDPETDPRSAISQLGQDIEQMGEQVRNYFAFGSALDVADIDAHKAIAQKINGLRDAIGLDIEDKLEKVNDEINELLRPYR